MSYSEGSSTTSKRQRRPNKKTVSDSTDKKPTEKKTRGNNSQAIEPMGRKGMVKRLSEAQMKKLKEHSKKHGGMGSAHMKKMIMVMTKEGKTFSEAHKIAVKKVGK